MHNSNLEVIQKRYTWLLWPRITIVLISVAQTLEKTKKEVEDVNRSRKMEQVTLSTSRHIQVALLTHCNLHILFLCTI